MLKEFIEKIEAMTAQHLTPLNGLTYTNKPLTLMVEPCASVVPLRTLTGLADLIKVKTDDLDTQCWLLQVVSHTEVRLIQKSTDPYGRRPALGKSECEDGQPFPFGRFIDREEFVIGLQSRFVVTPDLVETLKLASNLTASTVAQAEDDGIAQRTTVKQGVTLKKDVTVKSRVVLKPYRTFREVDQPSSEFVFRLRSRDGSVPDCALFEADGGKWKLDAVLSIKQWLDGQNLGMPVVA